MSSDTPRRLPLPRVSGPMIGLAVILGVFVVLLANKGQLGNFISLGNMRVLLHQSAVNAVVALGMLLVIVSGGIDLSVGSVLALGTVATLQAYTLALKQTDSVLLASLAGVAGGVLTGGLCGLANGLVVTGLKVSSFVATLGMFSIARGLAFWWTERVKLPIPGKIPAWVQAMQDPTSEAFVFSPAVWSAAVLAVLTAVLLRYTVLGRHCYAIGSSEPAARLCGVPVARQKVVLFVVAGLLTGWASVIRFAQVGGDPNSGQGLELEVIAAVVIGGASLSGGRGTVVGTLLGVFLLGILENVLGVLNVSIELKNIVLGAVVIVNTALSRWQSSRRGG
jgi:ribose transport system permease protein